MHDLVRALAPDIGARAFHPAFEGPVKVWRTRLAAGETGDGVLGAITARDGRIYVQCADGPLEVLELQAPGGRRLESGDFLRGRRLEGAFRS